MSARQPKLGFDVIVKFDAKPGTLDSLLRNGARNESSFLVEQGLGDLPLIKNIPSNLKLSVIHVKGESTAINFGLRSDSASFFNNNVLNVEVIKNF